MLTITLKLCYQVKSKVMSIKYDIIRFFQLKIDANMN